MSDEQIVQAFIRDYGMAIYLAPPNAFGWIVPYARWARAGGDLCCSCASTRPKPMTDLGPSRSTTRRWPSTKIRSRKILANLD